MEVVEREVQIPLSSDRGRSRLAPTVTAVEGPYPDRRETRIWELDLTRYLTPGPDDETSEEWNVNGHFVLANCSYKHVEEADLILTVPSDEDHYLDRLCEMEAWGCSTELLGLFRDAHASEVILLLFWC